MTILGIGGMGGDAAGAIVREGQLAVAVEEAKLARRGQTADLPERAIATCLSRASVEADAVDCVAIARPLAAGPAGDLHLRLRNKFPNSRVVLVEHHTAHAASAYFPSNFEHATVLTLDRAGEFLCGSRWRARGHELSLEKELYSPDSLGELYGRVTALLGFAPNLEEHKVQWLSVTGDDRYRDLFLEMMPARNGGWPHLDRSYFDSESQTYGGFSAKFFKRLGLTQGEQVPASHRAAIAAGLQRALESRVIDMAGEGENLCFAGGLGLNALLVSALERCSRFRNVFVQPAAGNAGTAIGAALHAWHTVYGQKQRVSLGNLCLGPSFPAEEIKQVLENCKLRFRYFLTTEELIETALAQLQEGKIVAWMQGRMEFGPRALGNRSILASPLNPYSTQNLNEYIKHRESFRKFAASVPEEEAHRYFEPGQNARFLATVSRIRPEYREQFKSAILADDLIRVHLVSKEDNPLYWRLLKAAGDANQLPVLYNTSFNLFGEPLVCNPRDAVRSFYSSGIDAMFLGNFFLQK